MAEASEAGWSADSISILNELIETSKDGEQGFRSAAESVEDPEIKQQFSNYAQERRQFASELQEIVDRTGGEAQTRGSVAGALHRGWMYLKGAATGHDDHAVAAAAETGEDSAVRTYQTALASPELRPEVRAVIERQYMRVKDAHDYVRRLRDRLASSPRRKVS